MTDKKQIDKFRVIAIELEYGESEEAFANKFGKFVKKPATSDKGKSD